MAVSVDDTVFPADVTPGPGIRSVPDAEAVTVLFAWLELDRNWNILLFIIRPWILGLYHDQFEVSSGIKIGLKLIQRTQGVDITRLVGKVTIKHLRYDDILITGGLSEKEEGPVSRLSSIAARCSLRRTRTWLVVKPALI